MKKDRIYIYVLLFIVLCLSIFSISQYTQRIDSEKLVKTYKNELIDSDSLLQVAEGKYQKLVDDRLSQNELNRALKEQNRELYDLLKEERKKPISYTIIQAQPETKVDTIPIETGVRDGNIINSFVDYYPKEENYFAKYKAEIQDSTVTGEWSFNSLDIGIVVSEKQKGIFEANLDAPEWLKVNKLEVKSLPLENLDPDNFDWFLGGNVGLNMMDDSPVLEVEGGFRVKKSMFSLLGNTNQEIKVGFKKLF